MPLPEDFIAKNFIEEEFTADYSLQNSTILFQKFLSLEKKYFENLKSSGTELFNKEEQEEQEEDYLTEFLESVNKIFDREDKNKIMAEFASQLCLKGKKNYLEPTKVILFADYKFDKKNFLQEFNTFYERREDSDQKFGIVEIINNGRLGNVDNEASESEPNRDKSNPKRRFPAPEASPSPDVQNFSHSKASPFKRLKPDDASRS